MIQNFKTLLQEKKVATFRLKYTKIKILPNFKTRVHQELISAYFSKYWNPADCIDYQIKIRLYSKSVASFKLSLEQAAKKMKKSWKTEKSRNG